MRGQGWAGAIRETEGPWRQDGVVLDTSALMAVLLRVSTSVAEAVLDSDARLLISAGTLAEALMVADNLRLGTEMAALVAQVGVEVVPVTAATAARVAEAYATWGTGNHPAGLNFGDCFAYVLARETGRPLLYEGPDFSRTDVAAADQDLSGRFTPPAPHRP